MESLEKLQRQLSTLNELRSIVKTMKALSAASIRQYEQAVSALATYSQTVERGLHVVVKGTAGPQTSIRRQSSNEMAAIVFGSDHGLCGRFNETINEFALDRLNATGSMDEPRIITVGARAGSAFEHLKVPIEEQFTLPSSTHAISRTVQQLLFKIDQWQQQHMIQNVSLFFNQHTRAQGYKATEQVLLPIDLERFRELPEGHWQSNSLPIYRMKREHLLSNLIHQYLFVSLFRACAESQASEHASRLSAMKSAQRNLDERLNEVSMQFRHARQTEITAELLDIISGFETIVGRH